ncbi:phosphatidylglycerophosphatase A [Celeribacter arenosi]|uniref:Phosphatidylglycerophosphatase A n=1 Tax=Celeribacter arenosi TaxID=792649 RepID=A0ABP7KJ27_9RHOB
MKELAEAIATLARVGYLKPAPGTWGSAASVPLLWALHQTGGTLLVCAGIVVAFVVGLWSIQEWTRGDEDPDHAEIVIDELVGQWIALLPVSVGATIMGVDSSVLWPGWIAGFVLFRLFDIWKPLWIGKADKRGDAMGVMLDDVLAGIAAAAVTLVLAGLTHGLMMQ